MLTGASINLGQNMLCKQTVSENCDLKSQVKS